MEVIWQCRTRIRIVSFPEGTLLLEGSFCIISHIFSYSFKKLKLFFDCHRALPLGDIWKSPTQIKIEMADAHMDLVLMRVEIVGAEAASWLAAANVLPAVPEPSWVIHRGPRDVHEQALRRGHMV